MHGSLAYRSGVLYVGRHAKTAWVRAFDLDGRPLETSFSFRDAEQGRSSVSGLDVDLDHRVWIADGAARRVRAFTLFGTEVVSLADPSGEGPGEDLRGRLGTPADVSVQGADDELVVAVASGGRRRHALQLLDATGGRVLSVRPHGDPRGTFRGLTGLALRGDLLYACEGGRERVHVYRDGDFHFEFGLPLHVAGRAVPTAVDVLDDGRSVVAVAGDHSALLLFDRAGRLLRVLAQDERTGADGGQDAVVSQPGDVVFAPGADDRTTRVVAIDRDGERVQVLTLEGHCYGEFAQLTGS